MPSNSELFVEIIKDIGEEIPFYLVLKELRTDAPDEEVIFSLQAHSTEGEKYTVAQTIIWHRDATIARKYLTLLDSLSDSYPGKVCDLLCEDIIGTTQCINVGRKIVLLYDNDELIFLYLDLLDKLITDHYKSIFNFFIYTAGIARETLGHVYIRRNNVEIITQFLKYIKVFSENNFVNLIRLLSQPDNEGISINDLLLAKDQDTAVVTEYLSILIKTGLQLSKETPVETQRTYLVLLAVAAENHPQAVLMQLAQVDEDERNLGNVLAREGFDSETMLNYLLLLERISQLLIDDSEAQQKICSLLTQVPKPYFSPIGLKIAYIFPTVIFKHYLSLVKNLISRGVPLSQLFDLLKQQNTTMWTTIGAFMYSCKSEEDHEIALDLLKLLNQLADTNPKEIFEIFLLAIEHEKDLCSSIFTWHGDAVAIACLDLLKKLALTNFDNICELLCYETAKGRTLGTFIAYYQTAEVINHYLMMLLEISTAHPIVVMNSLLSRSEYNVSIGHRIAGITTIEPGTMNLFFSLLRKLSSSMPEKIFEFLSIATIKKDEYPVDADLTLAHYLRENGLIINEYLQLLHLLARRHPVEVYHLLKLNFINVVDYSFKNKLTKLANDRSEVIKTYLNLVDIITKSHPELALELFESIDITTNTLINLLVNCEGYESFQRYFELLVKLERVGGKYLVSILSQINDDEMTLGQQLIKYRYNDEIACYYFKQLTSLRKEGLLSGEELSKLLQQRDLTGDTLLDYLSDEQLLAILIEEPLATEIYRCINSDRIQVHLDSLSRSTRADIIKKLHTLGVPDFIYNRVSYAVSKVDFWHVPIDHGTGIIINSERLDPDCNLRRRKAQECLGEEEIGRRSFYC